MNHNWAKGGRGGSGERLSAIQTTNTAFPAHDGDVCVCFTRGLCALPPSFQAHAAWRMRIVSHCCCSEGGERASSFTPSLDARVPRCSRKHRPRCCLIYDTSGRSSFPLPGYFPTSPADVINLNGTKKKLSNLIPCVVTCSSTSKTKALPPHGSSLLMGLQQKGQILTGPESSSCRQEAPR